MAERLPPLPEILGGKIRDGGLEISLDRPLGAGESLILSLEGGGQHPSPCFELAALAAEGAGFVARQSLAGVEQPFEQVSVRLRQGGTEQKLDTDKPGFQLHTLYAPTEKRFAEIYFNKRNRVTDPETLTFACEQFFRHYRLNPAHLAVITVIYGYRALDAASPGRVRTALQRVAEIEPAVRALPSSRSPRTDRDSLLYSVNVIQWHLTLYLGDREATLAALGAAHDEAAGNLHPYFMAAFNACRSLLLLGYLRAGQGERVASEAVFRTSFDLYRNAIADFDGRGLHFNELAQAHRAAALGLMCQEEVQRKRQLLRMPSILEAVLRIDPASPAGATMRQNLKAMLADAKVRVA
ncbi:hypothetical protein BKE38_15145 [Pseudoroseomonas deserti]|uniref:Uncharacterized protein n=1 Tax=Teichococcus deserti TaxID=1817963 RepID=A0A1V2H0K5_9PROT|nr:hypothetical protein [Pseudoroseomonas deserti]ONG52034.1 hypothetical protein BKE38_15145 [Pseudoroseomonas deserti]